MSAKECLIKHVPKAYWDEVKKYAEAYKKRGLSEDEANLRAAEDMVKMLDAELARVEGEVVAAYEKSPLYQGETNAPASTKTLEQEIQEADERDAREAAAVKALEDEVQSVARANAESAFSYSKRDYDDLDESIDGARQNVVDTFAENYSNRKDLSADVKSYLNQRALKAFDERVAELKAKGQAQREGLIKEGREYEGRLFGGSYGADRLRTAAKDAPIRKIVQQARERYNAIRTELGLEPVTDWGVRPEFLVDRLPYAEGQAKEVTAATTKGEVGDFIEVVQEAKTLGEALTLARANATPGAQALIDGLLKLPNAVAAAFSARRTGKPETGIYVSESHTVKLFEGASIYTLLHEAVHAATVNSLAQHVGERQHKATPAEPFRKFYGKTDTGRQLVKLFEAAQKAIKDRKLNPGFHYGMTDMYEFVSEAFTDRDFQILLASIPYESPKKTMFDKFTALVKNMLGLSKDDAQISSVLDAVISASEGLMQENEQLIGTTDVIAARARPQLDNLKVNSVGKFRRGLMQFMFLRDLVREKGNILVDEDGNSLVKKYVDKVFAMASYANEKLNESSKIARRWESLGKEATQLSELAADATYSQIHPDIPLDMESHETSIPGKMISNRHLADADGKFSDRVRAEYERLQRQHAALSKEARQVYTQARDNMARNWDERERLLNDVARAVYDPQIQQAEKDGNAKLASKLRRDMRNYLVEVGAALSRLNGPYFPLERFGKYYVVYKSEAYTEAEAELTQANEEFARLLDEYDVPVGEERKVIERMDDVLEKAGGTATGKLSAEQKAAIKAARKRVTEARKKTDELAGDPTAYRNEAFENEAAAKALAKELGVKVHLQQEQLQEVFGMSRALVNKVTDYVGAGMPEGQANEVRRAMMEIFLKSKPDMSATRNELRRRNVAGFSRDMLRSYSSYAKRDAHYLSRLKYTDETTAALYDMNKAAKADSLEAEELVNELTRRHAASLNYVETPGQDLLSSTAFVWQLALSPSFWLINTTQPWMVSYPFMMGRHGMGRTAKALFDATADTWGAMKTSMKEQGTVFFEVDTSKFSPDEKTMLDDALRAGLLDITLEMDVGAIAEGKATTSATGKVTRAISVVPHQIEVANRVATALASYRLEKQKLGARDDAKSSAMEYAKRVLDKTHFDYSATNAPYWLKPGVFPFSKILFQYRKYQIGVLSLVATQWKQAMKGATPAERREARNALFGLAATHGALAGAVGLPFASTAFFIADVIAKAFGDDDEPWEGAEVAFRNYLADVFGVEAGAVIAKGLPMALGVDLSGRLGAGDIATPIKLLRDNKEGRDLYLEILAGIAGPAIGGLGAKAADGVQYVSQGDIVKGAEQFLPKMFADMLKAHRISEEGVTTRKNMVALGPERIDAMDTFLMALGIPVNDVTERGEAVGAFENVKKQLQDRRSELTKAYVEAREKGDNDRLIGIRNAVREFNTKRRANGEKLLTEAELLQAFQQRRRTQKEFTQQGVLVRKSERPLTQYSRFADVE